MGDVVGLVSAAYGLFVLGAVMLYVRNATANGALGRNAVIGIRTKATKSSDRAWEAGHRTAGSRMLAAPRAGFLSGILTIAVGIVQVVGDLRGPAGLIVPAAGYLALVILAIAAAKTANEAGRSVFQGSDDRSRCRAAKNSVRD